MSRFRRNTDVLHFFIPVYETYSHGQEVLVEPTVDSAFVWVQGEGIVPYLELERRVEDGEVKNIEAAGYFYRGHYYVSGTPKCDDIMDRLEQGQQLLNRTEQVEVFKIERVVDWWFTAKAVVISSIGLNFLILLNYFILKLGSV